MTISMWREKEDNQSETKTYLIFPATLTGAVNKWKLLLTFPGLS